MQTVGGKLEGINSAQQTQMNKKKYHNNHQILTQSISASHNQLQSNFESQLLMQKQNSAYEVPSNLYKKEATIQNGLQEKPAINDRQFFSQKEGANTFENQQFSCPLSEIPPSRQISGISEIQSRQQLQHQQQLVQQLDNRSSTIQQKNPNQQNPSKAALQNHPNMPKSGRTLAKNSGKSAKAALPPMSAINLNKLAGGNHHHHHLATGSLSSSVGYDGRRSAHLQKDITGGRVRGPDIIVPTNQHQHGTSLESLEAQPNLISSAATNDKGSLPSKQQRAARLMQKSALGYSGAGLSHTGYLDPNRHQMSRTSPMSHPNSAFANKRSNNKQNNSAAGTALVDSTTISAQHLEASMARNNPLKKSGQTLYGRVRLGLNKRSGSAGGATHKPAQKQQAQKSSNKTVSQNKPLRHPTSSNTANNATTHVQQNPNQTSRPGTAAGQTKRLAGGGLLNFDESGQNSALNNSQGGTWAGANNSGTNSCQKRTRASNTNNNNNTTHTLTGTRSSKTGRLQQQPGQTSRKTQKRVRQEDSMVEFLDANMKKGDFAANQAEIARNSNQNHQAKKDHLHNTTLNILADSLRVEGEKSADNHHHGLAPHRVKYSQPRIKSVAQRSNPHQQNIAAGGQGHQGAQNSAQQQDTRSLIQTKYLNFQRDAQKKKRGKSAQDTSNYHRSKNTTTTQSRHQPAGQQHQQTNRQSGAASRRTGGDLLSNAQHGEIGGGSSKDTNSRPLSKSGLSNPFRPTSRERNQGGNQSHTIELVESRRRSQSRQFGGGNESHGRSSAAGGQQQNRSSSGGMQSNATSRKRAKSGGHENESNRKSSGYKAKRQQQTTTIGGGATTSFSPRSRKTTTQFVEARSVLIENNSSGISVNSRKHQQQNSRSIRGIKGSGGHSKTNKAGKGQLEPPKLLASETQLDKPAFQSRIVHHPEAIQKKGFGGLSAKVLAPKHLSVIIQQQMWDKNIKHNLASNHQEQPMSNSLEQNQKNGLVLGDGCELRDDSMEQNIFNGKLYASSGENFPGASAESMEKYNQNHLHQCQPRDVIVGSQLMQNQRKILNRTILEHSSLGKVFNKDASLQEQRKGGRSQSPKGAKQRGNQAQQRGKENGVPQDRNRMGTLTNKEGTNSARNTKIDKIIQENLKKQSRKSLMKRQHEREIAIQSRLKRIELQEANERVRKANQEKVQKRKQQEMLAQTNAALYAAQGEEGGLKGKSDFLLKGGTKLDTMILEKNLKSLLANNEGDFAEMSGLLDGISDKQSSIKLKQIMSGEASLVNPINAQTILGPQRDPFSPEDQATRSQKLNISQKFNCQQRLDGLMQKIRESNRPVGATSQLANKPSRPVSRQNNAGVGIRSSKNQLEKQSLAVNRLNKGGPVGMGGGGGGYAAERRKRKQHLVDDSENNNLLLNETDYEVRQQDLENVSANVSETGKSRPKLKETRRGNGLEFIEIRRELRATQYKLKGEMKSKKIGKDVNGLSTTSGNLHKLTQSAAGFVALRTSKSVKQVGPNVGSKDEKQEQNNEDAIFDLKDNDFASQKPEKDTQQQPVLKKKRIRKFMKQKQKQMEENELSKKEAVIQKTLQIHENLLKLDKFAKKKLKTVQGSGGFFNNSNNHKERTSNQVSLRQPRNNNEKGGHRNATTIVYDESAATSDPFEFEKNSGERRNANMTITPNKLMFEVSENSFNVSGKPQSKNKRNLIGVRHKKQTRSRDDEHNNGKNNYGEATQQQTQQQQPTISDIREETIGELRAHDSTGEKQKKDKDQQSRGACSSSLEPRKQSRDRSQSNQNGSLIHGTAALFENSSSAKTLRAQLQATKNVQQQQSSHSPQSGQRPLQFSERQAHFQPVNNRKAQLRTNRQKQSAMQKMIPKQGGVQQSLKPLKQSSKSKKRIKSLTRKSLVQIPLTAPKNNNSGSESGGKFTVKIPEVSVIQQHQHPTAANKHTRHDRLSTQTLESLKNSHSRQGRRSSSSPMRQPVIGRYTQSVSQEDGAAKLIQREVRRYLKDLGFYEAKRSPERNEPQINLFIERKMRSSSGNNSGSRKRKTSGAPSRGTLNRSSQKVSKQVSPERQPTFSKGQERTIIAQLSGYKRSALFGDDHSSDIEVQVYEKSLDLTGKNDLLQPNNVVADYSKKKQIRGNQSGKRTSQKAKTQKQSESKVKRADRGDRVDQGNDDVLSKVQILQSGMLNGISGIDSNSILQQVVIEEDHPHPVGIGADQNGNQYPLQNVRNHQVLLDQYEIKSQLTPLSRQGEINMQHGSYSAAHITSQEGSDFDIRNIQMSVESSGPENLAQKPNFVQNQATTDDIRDKNGGYGNDSQGDKAGNNPNQTTQNHNVHLLNQNQNQNQALNNNNFDNASQSSSSMFDRNSFQQYSQKQLRTIMRNSEHSKLIKFKEEVLKFKERRERKHIQRLFKQNQCSPRTYQAKKKAIDRWVNVERQEIERTKTTFEEEWEKTVKMIEDTQKSVNQIRCKMNINSQGALSQASITSNQRAASAGQQGSYPDSSEQKGHNSLAQQIGTNFNSQSVMSQSSYRKNYPQNNANSGVLPANANANANNPQASFNIVGQTNLQTDPHRSILIDDPPKSYRSGKHEVTGVPSLALGSASQQQQAYQEGSVGALSSRRSAGAGTTTSGIAPGPTDQLAAANNLLRFVDKKLHARNLQSESKPTGKAGSERGEEKSADSLTPPLEFTGKKEPDRGGIVTFDDRVKGQGQQAVQRRIGGEKVGGNHSRGISQTSIPDESDLSHQPSAEFLERLEQVNHLQQLKDASGALEGFAVDGPMPPSIISAITDKDGVMQQNPLQITENQFADSSGLQSADMIQRQEQVASGPGSTPVESERDQIVNLKDLRGILDSKRTSDQSEMSNQNEFKLDTPVQTNKEKNGVRGLGQYSWDRNHENLEDSPERPREHLEEPQMVSGSTEPQIFDSTKVNSTINKTSSSENIKIAEMLQQQQALGSGADFSSLYNQQLNAPLDDRQNSSDKRNSMLQEPEIIQSTAQSIPHDQQADPPLYANLSEDKLKELMKSDPDQKEKVLDQLLDEIMKSLLKDSLQIPDRKDEQSNKRDAKEKDSDKDADRQGGSGSGSGSGHDVYYVDQLQSEREERREWIELRQRHLIENDLIRIDQYVNEILDALLQFEIDLSSEEMEAAVKADSDADNNGADNYHIKFLKQLTQPIKKSPISILQNLQTSEIGSYRHFETTQDLQKHPIIPVDLYLEIEKAREEAMLSRRNQNMTKQTQMVWESIHIQNKCFFDSVNESLMKFRPYGLSGEPMPWSNKVRRLQTQVEISSVDTERLFQMVKQEAFRWAQTFCGSLPSPVFCFPLNHHSSNEEFIDELFQENREKKLTQVLSAETIEQEHHWLNYEYEEAQVKIDLSDMILEHLVEELATLMNNMHQKDGKKKGQQAGETNQADSNRKITKEDVQALFAEKQPQSQAEKIKAQFQPRSGQTLSGLTVPRGPRGAVEIQVLEDEPAFADQISIPTSNKK